jgi:hypothetical protein
LLAGIGVEQQLTAFPTHLFRKVTLFGFKVYDFYDPIANHRYLCAHLVNGPLGKARIETIMKKKKTPQIPAKMLPL